MRFPVPCSQKKCAKFSSPAHSDQCGQVLGSSTWWVLAHTYSGKAPLLSYTVMKLWVNILSPKAFRVFPTLFTNVINYVMNVIRSL